MGKENMYKMGEENWERELRTEIPSQIQKINRLGHADSELGAGGIINEENKKDVALISRDENITLMVKQISTDSNWWKSNNYINVSEEKNKEATKNVALMVKHKVLAELSDFNDNNYINVSVDDDDVEDAPVALMVKHQSDKLGPSGHLGSIPGRGVSTPEISDDKCYTLTDISLKEVGACYNYSWKYFADLDKTEEAGAFDWLSSLTSWTNMPITSAVIGILGFNYSDSKDSAEVDIYIEVPSNEPPATRSSTIIFTSSLDE